MEKYCSKKAISGWHLSGVLICIPLSSFAQTQLDPIIIESAAIREGTSVLATEIARMRAASSDSASLLRDVPGVALNGAGAVSSLPSIRGLADDRLRIKVDGTDLIASCPNHMNPPMSYLDPSNIGVLKVFAGITPVSLGGDSIGGTVVAETQKPAFVNAGEEALTGGEVGAFYRSNNKAVGGHVALNHAGENLSVGYNGSWSKADNYKAGGDFKTYTDTGRVGHTLALDEVGSTAYETQNHSLNLAVRAQEHLFTAQLSYQNMPEQLYPNQRMDLLGNEQTLLNLAWSRPFEWGSMEARVYHERVNHFMDFGDDKRFWYGSLSGAGSPCAPIRFSGDPLGTCAAGMPMYSESTNTGLSLKADIDLSERNLLRTGFEYQRYRLDDYWTASGGGMGPGTFENIDNGKRDRSAVYAELESQFDAQWLALVGMRYERVSMNADEVQGYNTAMTAPGMQYMDSTAFNAQDRRLTDHNLDVMASARYQYSESFDMEFGVARKVRSPNVYERYTWSTWPMAATMNNFVGDGNGYVGDVNLKPEVAYTFSTTFDWHAAERDWEVKVTPFFTHVDDYIDAVRRTGWASGQYNVLQYANQSARLYGLDLSWKAPLGVNDMGEWGVAGLINYVHGENRETGGQLYNIMPLNARFTLMHQKAGWDSALEWLVVDGKEASDVRNEIATSGYSLVNLRTSRTWGDLRLDLGVENLFDRHYTLPTGGAYMGQGRTMSMNGVPWGDGVPGMGRSVYLGVNMKF